MAKQVIYKLFFTAISGILFLFSISHAQNSSSTTSLERLWYYTESARSRESFFKNSLNIDVLGPQVYFLGFDGRVIGSVQSDVLAEAKLKNIKVMPLIANITKLPNNKEFFNQKIIHDLLESKENWNRISTFMISEAKVNNYYGYQLDLENINIKNKQNFLDFVKFLKLEFNKENLKLSAAIVSKISDDEKDYAKSYWQNWAGVYDYIELSQSLDFVSVMAYDQPRSPGPVATQEWSDRVMKYTLTKIPKEKVSFGIPTYSWVYRSQDLKNKKMHFRMVDYGLMSTWKAQQEKQKLIKLSAEGYKKAYRDYWVTGSGVSTDYGGQEWLSYNLNGKNYTIWSENADSFKSKLDAIKSAGVRGYSAWVLGDEDVKVWEMK
jgi:spore germination protein